MSQLHWLSACQFCWKMKVSGVASAAASSEPETQQWSGGLAEVPSDLNLRGISCSGWGCSFTLNRWTWGMGCQLKSRHSLGQLCSAALAIRLHIGRNFPCTSFAFICLSSSLAPLTGPCFTGISFFQAAQRHEQLCRFLPARSPSVADVPSMSGIAQPFFSTCVHPVPSFLITFSFFHIIFFCWPNNSLGPCNHPSLAQKIMPWSWFLSQRQES